MQIRFIKQGWRDFSITRYWSGKLIYINVWHWAAVLDLRQDWVSDMTNGKMNTRDIPTSSDKREGGQTLEVGDE